METIKLHDGRIEKFPTAENECYKFLYCDTYEMAKSLFITLTELANKCSIGENSRGWFVRIHKS